MSFSRKYIIMSILILIMTACSTTENMHTKTDPKNSQDSLNQMKKSLAPSPVETSPKDPNIVSEREIEDLEVDASGSDSNPPTNNSDSNSPENSNKEGLVATQENLQIDVTQASPTVIAQIRESDDTVSQQTIVTPVITRPSEDVVPVDPFTELTFDQAGSDPRFSSIFTMSESERKIFLSDPNETHSRNDKKVIILSKKPDSKNFIMQIRDQLYYQTLSTNITLTAFASSADQDLIAIKIAGLPEYALRELTRINPKMSLPYFVMDLAKTKNKKSYKGFWTPELTGKREEVTSQLISDQDLVKIHFSEVQDLIRRQFAGEKMIYVPLDNSGEIGLALEKVQLNSSRFVVHVSLVYYGKILTTHSNRTIQVYRKNGDNNNVVLDVDRLHALLDITSYTEFSRSYSPDGRQSTGFKIKGILRHKVVLESVLQQHGLDIKRILLVYNDG
ncbi:MAG: hypothetical protein ACRCTJ_02550, partial [Brevinema sp.]